MTPEFKHIFCIDGSGNKDQRAADLKRPIYRVEVADREITRIGLNGDTAFAFFKAQFTTASPENRILIAADVAIGLPSKPELPWGEAKSFAQWLHETQRRIGESNWRDELIADDLSHQSFDQPFVKVKKGTKSQIGYKRLCDTITNGESVYCIDSGTKQVGRASLQFWFEVLMPLREAFPGKVGIWPFEPLDDKPIVIAECYPTASQLDLKLERNIKRNAPKVVEAILALRKSSPEIKVAESTWFHAVSSEDEFDTFTTAFAFAHRNDLSDLMWYPTGDEFSQIATREGWMLGLRNTAKPQVIPISKERVRTARPSTPKVAVGEKNRNDQENAGPSGTMGPKGPMVAMVCRRMTGSPLCGHKYETNPQDVFQKRCPVCQKKR